ncbi:CapA family protein [Paenibacillus filicis]|uniref:CapA family protein n=1 Tax=Paenibacillus gyeongsangnamensis TaxID=3388067 RepID=A0ABT4Q2Q5_9BACL|nr:CapA family protein [Paenibacillus filicis]MCZ8511086.1 CapA family protein [Paenibacillus filicis]
MPTEIRIAAVGDIMMRSKLILAAQLPGDDKKRYSFDGMFEKIAPYLKKADLTIGNLETVFAGTDETANFKRQPRNPKNSYPLFNCPDELGKSLGKAGFDVLITANNHCMDYGIQGLQRTLDVLDRNRIAHTGTSRSFRESKDVLIKNINGIAIGILAYTLGTNSIPVPRNEQWAVNRIQPCKIIHDIRQLKKKTDVVIVCLHFGKEYRLLPDERQKRLVHLLFKHGADIILGSHPHVVQPAEFHNVADIYGVRKKRFVIYSLGNLITTRLKLNDHTKNGVIAQISLRKDDRGKVEIIGARFIPTWVLDPKYQIVPLSETLQDPQEVSEQELTTMRKIYKQVSRRLTIR